MNPAQRLKNWAMRFPRPAGRMRLPEECVCRCHYGAPVLHVIDCCRSCPHCNRDIATAFYDAHVEKCARKAIEIPSV